MKRTHFILIFIFIYIATGIIYSSLSKPVYINQNKPIVDNTSTSTDVTSPGIDFVEPGEELVDPFNIKMLNLTSTNGRVWYSKWNNGKLRTIKSGARDFYDNDFIARGTGTISIDGKGVATLSGDTPRIYVYDAKKVKKWNNVEITVYSKRISESAEKSSQGIVIGARSEHQDVSTELSCSGKTYYGRLLYDGRAVFQKEIIHSDLYSTNKPEENHKATWETSDGNMPKNIWIGLKYVVHTNPDGKSVNLKLYRDLTDGKDGGKWEKVAEYTDSGDWFQDSSDKDVLQRCGYSENTVLLNPGTSVFIRNDNVTNVKYKWFSIREIN